MIAAIYKKETGEKLAFFERVNFNAEWSNNAKWKMQTAKWGIRNELRVWISYKL